jgi:UDP-glucose 6-dehydrogenase
MKKYNILFIGFGVIGQYEYTKLVKLQPDIYDKYKPEVNTKRNIIYDFAFICVPTPTNEQSLCDTSLVEEVIQEQQANIYIVKSTVIPGTCKALAEKYNKHIVFSPENYGATQHASNFEYDFTVLGGAAADCYKVQQMLQEVFDARHTFKITDSTTAELSKYMLNSYLAMKVNFCNAFWEICNQYGEHYEDLRECFVLDHRINPAHTFVYDDAPYWDSHCFNKDVPAIANATNNQFLKNIENYNNYLKDKYQNK